MKLGLRPEQDAAGGGGGGGGGAAAAAALDREWYFSVKCGWILLHPNCETAADGAVANSKGCVTAGHGRSRQVTAGHGRSRQVTAVTAAEGAVAK